MQLRIFVISVDQLRLRSFFNSNPWFSKADLQIINGVIPEKAPDQFTFVDSNAFEYIHKRKMVTGELGAVLSHYICYQEIVKGNYPWSLILEDNAILSESQLSFVQDSLQEINRIPASNPTLVHLYPQHLKGFPVSFAKNSDYLFQHLVIPRIAKGYLVNYSLAKIATIHTFPINEVADWPSWIARCQVLSFNRNLLSIDRSHSSNISGRPQSEILPTFCNRFVTAILMITLIEFFRYRKATKRKDYFRIVLVDRLQRYLLSIQRQPTILEVLYRSIK